MKTFLLVTAAATLTCVIAPSAQATQYLNITAPSGTFGDDSVICADGAIAPCDFSRTFQFMTPAGYNLTSATISSVVAGNNQATNIDFTSVTLNGIQFTNIISDGSEYRNLFNQPLAPNALNTLLVNGTTGGGASFSGTLSFAATAVPEPSTWGMMILGTGVIGGAMRRRRTIATRISYAA